MGKILVAYATRTGTTEEVAGTIAEVLKEAGQEVDVHPAGEVRDLSGYDAVILGSAVRAGRLMPEVRRFVRTRREDLQGLPVAAFAVCMVMREDTEANRRKASGYLKGIRQVVTPVAEGLFAGTVRPERLGFFARLAMRLVKAPAGDFRNWSAIRAWAADLLPALRRD